MSKFPTPYKWLPTNQHKYVGDVNGIWVRSSWEKKTFIWCDETNDVLKWSSEELVIPYISPVDNRPHRYFTDLTMRIRDKTGNEQMYVVEIKPKAQTEMPKKPKRMSKSYLKAIETFAINSAKWKAAEKFCESNQMKFVILTEDIIKP